jgi:hypothetical protein
MACIDSTHGGDASGGKLMTFGIVLHRKSGYNGSNYHHGCIPLVFARVLEENYEESEYQTIIM